VSQQKLAVDIETALCWVYQREMLCHDGLFGMTLPRVARPGWTAMIDTGTQVDESYEPRFPVGAGAPHPDALIIDYAVRQLPPVRMNWPRDGRHLMGDYLPYAKDNPLVRDMASSPVSALNWGGHARVSTKLQPPIVEPYELTPASLVMMYARLGRRPIWDLGKVRLARCKPVMEGRQKGKNFYTTGSHCPLQLDPPAAEIAAARFDYLMWHDALVALLGVNDSLNSIALQHPRAPAAPWLGEVEADAAPAGKLWRVNSPSVMPRLPLKPERDRALPPLLSDIQTEERRRKATRRRKILTTPVNVA